MLLCIEGQRDTSVFHSQMILRQKIEVVGEMTKSTGDGRNLVSDTLEKKKNVPDGGGSRL